MKKASFLRENKINQEKWVICYEEQKKTKKRVLLDDKKQSENAVCAIDFYLLIISFFCTINIIHIIKAI